MAGLLFLLLAAFCAQAARQDPIDPGQQRHYVVEPEIAVDPEHALRNRPHPTLTVHFDAGSSRAVSDLRELVRLGVWLALMHGGRCRS